MGQKVSVYLSIEALEILDKIIQERPLVIALRVNRSTVINDLILQEGEAYLAKLHLLHEAIERYAPRQDSRAEQETMTRMATALLENRPLTKVIWGEATDEEVAE